VEVMGPMAPLGPMKSAMVILLAGSAFSKMTPSSTSRSSGFRPGKAGGKQVSWVLARGATAVSSSFCLRMRAVFLTAQPLTDRLVEVSGVMVKKPASSMCLKRTVSTGTPSSSAAIWQ